MKSFSDKHNRKSIRLKDYNYSQAGCYFVTICANDRLQLFGKIVGGNIEMNEIGKLTFKILFDLPKRFNNIEIDSSILMPNHLHTIIIINEPTNVDVGVGVELALPKNKSNEEEKDRASSAPTTNPPNVLGVGVELALPKNKSNEDEKGRASSAPTLGRIIQVFKSISTIEINRYRGISGVPVWQRNYYEHIIRNEKELYEIRKYIEFNPLNWKDDEYNV